jgi:hypothetical protein
LVKVPPLEQILCRGRFRHPGRYGYAPVFSSLHQNRRQDALKLGSDVRFHPLRRPRAETPEHQRLDLC